MAATGSMKLGGYGLWPGVATPFGRRPLTWDGEPLVVPTSDWASLVRSGYSRRIGVLFDGIPYAFGDGKLYTVTGTEAAPPTDDYTRSAALMITHGLSISCEMDRERGVAGGRSLDIVLRRQSLQDEGLTTALFKDAALTAVLTADVTDATATTFPVDDTTGWASEDVIYLGRECARYTSSSTTSFDGIVRGIAGLAHYHAANPQSGYATITDVPQWWRGRLVEVYEHLVGPDGRYLGEEWCVVGTYCRQLWRGTVDAEPQETAAGKVIRCLPAVRMGGSEIGAKLVFDVATDGQANPLLWVTRSDQISVHADGSVDGAGPHAGSVGEFCTLATWCAKAAADITSDISGSGTIRVIPSDHRPPSYIAVTGNYSVSPAMTVRAAAWFLVNGNYGSGQSSDSSSGLVTIPVDFNSAAAAWLVLRVPATEEFAEADMPDAGTGYITDGSGARELVRWDQKKTIATQPGWVAVRLAERQIDGPRSDPWRWGGSLTVVSGLNGTWADVFQTLLTSSGTGARGDFDRLGFGFGFGLPETWLDTSALADEPMAGTQVTAAAADRTALERILGGWLALWSRCLVQRRDASGFVVLSPASWVVTDDPQASTIAAADVLLDGHATPETIESPNTIVCEAAGGYEERGAKYVWRSVARVQAEGERSWRLKTPGATQEVFDLYAPSIVSDTHGQASVTLETVPGSEASELQPGDRVRLTTAHPTVYDWSTGTYAPATVNGVVHSREEDLFTGVPRLTVLLQGRNATNALLCPAPRVLRLVSSTVLELPDGEEERFVAGDAVTYYEPGNETATQVDALVSSVDTTAHTVTLDTAVAAAPGARLTFQPYTAAANDQADYMFVRSDKRWR